MPSSMVRSNVDAPTVIDGAGPSFDPADLFPSTGRHTYIVVVEDRRIVELRATKDNPNQRPAVKVDKTLLDREEVAELLGMNADRMCWKPVREKLEAAGLVGKRIGGRRKKWRLDDVLAYAERMGLTGKRRPGRPRKQP